MISQSQAGIGGEQPHASEPALFEMSWIQPGRIREVDDGSQAEGAEVDSRPVRGTRQISV